MADLSLNKIHVIKRIREANNMPLKAAKELAEEFQPDQRDLDDFWVARALQKPWPPVSGFDRQCELAALVTDREFWRIRAEVSDAHSPQHDEATQCLSQIAADMRALKEGS